MDDGRHKLAWSIFKIFYTLNCLAQLLRDILPRSVCNIQVAFSVGNLVAETINCRDETTPRLRPLQKSKIKAFEIFKHGVTLWRDEQFKYFI